MKNIIRSVLVIMLTVLLLTGCGSSKNLIDYDAPDELHTVHDDKETEEDPDEEETISELPDEEAGEEDIVDQDSGYVQIYGRKYASVEEMFRETDANWNTSDEYTSAVSSYTEIFSDLINSDLDFGLDVPHIGYAYIDGDDIPELLISFGNYHVCGVCLYRYDTDKGEASYIGEFGSFGSMEYFEKASLIQCYYGNGGCYTFYLSEMNGNKVILKDSWLIDGSGLVTDEFRYFHGYVVPDFFDGSREAFVANQANELFLNFEVDDSHQISGDEYSMDYQDGVGVPDEICVYVSYDEMCSIKV